MNNNLLVKYRKEVDKEISQCKQNIEERKKTKKYISYSSYVISELEIEIKKLFAINYGESVKMERLRIVLPPSHIETDVVFSMFEYCKILKKSPAKIAKDFSIFINASLKKKLIKSTDSIEGYVNITLNQTFIYEKILKSINLLNEDYGECDINKGKTVLIDYSSPNIAKPFGIGHLRSTVIGQALANLYSATGYVVIKDNHLGDWGTQFGALLYAYKNWGDETIVQKNPVEELKNLYVRFNEEATGNDLLKDKARKIFKKLENGDAEAVLLWKKFRDDSLTEFRKIYKDLGVTFDLMIGESYYTNSVKDLLNDLKNKNITIDTPEGAVLVEGLYKLPSFLVQKSDGSTLYVLRDILTVIHREEVFKPDVILYIVGSEQKLNFEQLFAICNMAGYSKNTKLYHVDFGLMFINGEKMSTRKGTLVNLNDVIDTVTKKAQEILISKGEVTTDKIEETAKTIGINAVTYSDLRQNRTSNVEFNWDRILNIESGSVIYLQYAYARILSILSKTNFSIDSLLNKKLNKFEERVELELALKLMIFPNIVQDSTESNSPHLVALYLEELVDIFNTFYAKISILNTKTEELKYTRLILLSAIAITIKKGLNLLNLKVLNKI